MIYHRIQRNELYQFRKAAMRSASRHREVCGMLVRLEKRLVLIPVTNAEKRMGSFLIIPTYSRPAIAAKGLHRNQIAGTYHSHPFWNAEPGEGDINGTWDGALMLILGCWNNKMNLWRIEGGKAKPIRFLRSLP